MRDEVEAQIKAQEEQRATKAVENTDLKLQRRELAMKVQAMRLEAKDYSAIAAALGADMREAVKLRALPLHLERRDR